MDMTSILVQVVPGGEATGGLDLAVEVARLVGGRVTGVLTGAASTAATSKAAFDARCADAGLTGEWISAEGDAIDRLADFSRYADLTVVDRRLGGVRGTVDGVGRLLSRAGSPLLVAPPAPARPFVLRHALVAWSDRREAARALHDAVPLLRRAATVTVLTVHPPGLSDAPDLQVADYLAWHGVQADLRINFAAPFEAPGAILAQARIEQADLLVMGGYGHSRVVEMVLGGATGHILEHADLPVFLSR